MLRDSRREGIGEAVWERFNKPKEKTLWYYSELATAFQKRRSSLPAQLVDELDEIIQELC